MLDGWYWNSVKAWREELLTRQKRLEKQRNKAIHPASPLLPAYNRLVIVNAKLIAALDAELGAKPS